MTPRNLADRMEAYVLELVRERGYTRHDAESEAFDIFIGADERNPERYDLPSKGDSCAS
jgi:hypothetical protein